jgi:hypothetical protein
MPMLLWNQLRKRANERTAQARDPATGRSGRQWTLPPRRVFLDAIDAAYGASLTREEGQFAVGTIVLVRTSSDLERASWPVRSFRQSEPLSSALLAKLSPAQKPGSNFLIVSWDEAELNAGNEEPRIVGVGLWPTHFFHYRALAVPPIGIRFWAPGALAVSMSTIDDVRYEGGHLVPHVPRILGAEEFQRPRIQPLLARMRGEVCGEEHPGWELDGWLYRLVSRVRQLGRGALFAFPGDPSDLEESLEHTPYVLQHPLPVGTAIRQSLDANSEVSQSLGGVFATDESNALASGPTTAEVRRNRAFSLSRIAEDTLAELARISAIDCAVVLSGGLLVHGFGHKLRPDPSSRPEIRLQTSMRASKTYDLSRRGSRHASAVAWVSERRDRGAILVSQDGGAFIVSRTRTGAVLMTEIGWAPPWYMGPPGRA